MTRKLFMVGVIVLVGRGTAGQLLIAIVLAGGFFAMHVWSWPYKQVADNALKLTVEMQIFCVVAVGLAMKAEADQGTSTIGYDVFLVRVCCMPPSSVRDLRSKTKKGWYRVLSLGVLWNRALVAGDALCRQRSRRLLPHSTPQNSQCQTATQSFFD